MNETLEHKGYCGSAQWSEEDRMLHGRILGIRDMVIYGGSGHAELEANFKGAVDEYFAFCEAESKTTDTPR